METAEDFRTPEFEAGIKEEWDEHIDCKCQLIIISWHLERNEILSRNQYGFGRNRGTQYALHDPEKNAPEAIDHGKIPVIVT